VIWRSGDRVIGKPVHPAEEYARGVILSILAIMAIENYPITNLPNYQTSSRELA
jgi:hypothetical protein